MIRFAQTIANTGRNLRQRSASLGFSVDVLLFCTVLIALNPHLFGFGRGQWFIFSPSAFESGQWWRLFTHPFVHVTWYHLFLDAGAFLLLYMGLEKQKNIHRIIHVFVCGIGSLGLTLLFCPAINSQGLCGISGIAHGLMAVSALELIQNRDNFRIGLISLAILISKCIYEVIVGDVLFSFLQFGLCGSPLVACHAGGVLGGVFSFFAIKWVNEVIKCRSLCQGPVPLRPEYLKNEGPCLRRSPSPTGLSLNAHGLQ